MSNNLLPEMLDRKVIYESDWVSLYSDKVKMPDGRIFDTYHKLHYPHESVCVVIVNEKDEILMIQSKRYVTSRLEWEIPAGRIESNESPEDAARRECLEETGCTLKDLKYLCCHNPSNGMSDLKLHVFGAKVATESMEIDHVYADTARIGVFLNGQANVTVKNFHLADAGIPMLCGKESCLTVNGETIHRTESIPL